MSVCIAQTCLTSQYFVFIWLPEDRLQSCLLCLGVDLGQVSAPLSTPLLGRVPAHVAWGHAVTRVWVSSWGQG